MIRVALLVLVLLSACAPCPSGVDTRTRWAREAVAACGAVEGCADLSGVAVFELPLEDVRDVCNAGSNTRGCYCEDCGAIVIADQRVRMAGCTADTENCFYTQQDIVLHELTHAAFGSGTADHPPEFEIALQAARASMR